MKTDFWTINRPLYGQDFSTSGKGMDEDGEFHYLVVADGHGKGNYIKLLSSDRFLWGPVVSACSSQKMYSEIQKQIRCLEFCDYINDGTTLSIVKIYKDKNMIKCYWIGDSQIRIFKDDEEIFKSKNHNGRNKKELKRLKETYDDGRNDTDDTDDTDDKYKIEKVPSLSVVDSKTLTMKNYPQIHFFTNDVCEKMMLTRSLGHNEKLFPSFETKTIMLNAENVREEKSKFKIRVIVASDGFWDMYCENDVDDKRALLTQNAKMLAMLAYQRWTQTWHINIKNRSKTKALSLESVDDVSVALALLHFH